MSGLLADRYRLISLAGRGVSAEVWLAHDERLDRHVAVKLFRLDRTDLDKRALERVLNEARIAATITHPSVVVIYDVDATSAAEGPFIVMEYVDGISLDRRLEAGPLEEDVALGIARDLAEALEVAHAKGIRHRDLKPSNVLLASDGRAKLADFGISRGVNSVTLTEEGALVGTLAYMPPEVASGEMPSAASDIWSLGATLYTMIEGHPPHLPNPETMNPAMAVTARVGGGTPDFSRAQRAARVLEATLSPTANQRPDATRLRELLGESEASRSPRGSGASAQPASQSLRRDPRVRKRRRLVVAAVLAVAALVGTAILLTNQEGPSSPGAGKSGPEARPVVPAQPPLKNGQHVTVVRTPGGAQAAVYRKHGGYVRIWSYANGRWAAVAKSSYPVQGPVGTQYEDYGPTTLVGYLPTGAESAVFLARGGYTGDGALNYVAFANGPNGWGVLAPVGGKSLVSTGHGGASAGAPDYGFPGSAGWFALSIQHGELVTVDDNGSFDNADSREFPLVRRWAWRDDRFVRVETNAFTARYAHLSFNASKAPLDGCPSSSTNGTYAESLVAEGAADAAGGSDVHLVIGPTESSVQNNSSSTCDLSVPRNFKMVIITRDNLQDFEPITAPAWLLFVPRVDGELEQFGTPNAYLVPMDLYVRKILSNTGGFSFQRDESQAPIKADIKFQNGEITGIALTDGTGVVPTSS